MLFRHPLFRQQDIYEQKGLLNALEDTCIMKHYTNRHMLYWLGCSFLAMPFLLELRALMDWMWTDTTLGISSWLQMEDIYANIFVLKCVRWAEKVHVSLVFWLLSSTQPGHRSVLKYMLLATYSTWGVNSDYITDVSLLVALQHNKSF